MLVVFAIKNLKFEKGSQTGMFYLANIAFFKIMNKHLKDHIKIRISGLLEKQKNLGSVESHPWQGNNGIKLSCNNPHENEPGALQYCHSTKTCYKVYLILSPRCDLSYLYNCFNERSEIFVPMSLLKVGKQKINQENNMLKKWQTLFLSQSKDIIYMPMSSMGGIHVSDLSISSSLRLA